jgi:hypothetical protein
MYRKYRESTFTIKGLWEGGGARRRMRNDCWTNKALILDARKGKRPIDKN